MTIIKSSTLFFISLTIATLLTLSGCNTMKGIGKDVKKAGSSLEKSAEKHDK